MGRDLFNWCLGEKPLCVFLELVAVNVDIMIIMIIIFSFATLYLKSFTISRLMVEATSVVVVV